MRSSTLLRMAENSSRKCLFWSKINDAIRDTGTEHLTSSRKVKGFTWFNHKSSEKIVYLTFGDTGTEYLTWDQGIVWRQAISLDLFWNRIKIVDLTFLVDAKSTIWRYWIRSQAKCAAFIARKFASALVWSSCYTQVCQCQPAFELWSNQKKK